MNAYVIDDVISPSQSQHVTPYTSVFDIDSDVAQTPIFVESKLGLFTVHPTKHVPVTFNVPYHVEAPEQ